jgi:A/G-specific adenine glycosylase
VAQSKQKAADESNVNASDAKGVRSIPAAPFRRSLLKWYRRQGRDLPWRRMTDPYPVLVSEFMLQQTPVSTVIPHFERWMRRFPNLTTLAAASQSDVLHAWQGLGYYTRARNLHATARGIFERHAGHVPTSLELLRGFPGVGRYTANAVLTFAFDKSVPIVEANITRLLTRLFDLRVPIDTSRGRETLWQHALNLLPKANAARYNSALIDLGALVCRPQPRCPLCPVQEFCLGKTRPGLPIKKARAPLKFMTEYHLFALRGNHVLLEQSQDRWRGMWMLPRLKTIPRKQKPLHISEFPFTNHRITLIVLTKKVHRPSSRFLQHWFPIDQIASLPLPSPHRRALEKLTCEKPKKRSRTNGSELISSKSQ